MALPEKEWFTLEEIAQRWGCSVEDLWHYAIAGLLQMSALSLDLTKQHGDTNVAIYGVSLTCVLAVFQFGTYEEWDGFTSTTLADQTVPEIPLNFSLTVTKQSLVIARAERDRFEQEYRISAAAGKMPSQSEMLASTLRSRQTKRVQWLLKANEKFWRLYDPSDPSTAPTNEQVVAYLKEQGASQRLAQAMATILRAEDLPPGPRK
jgi:hypothetical protein